MVRHQWILVILFAVCNHQFAFGDEKQPTHITADAVTEITTKLRNASEPGNREQLIADFEKHLASKETIAALVPLLDEIKLPDGPTDTQLKDLSDKLDELLKDAPDQEAVLKYLEARFPKPKDGEDGNNTSKKNSALHESIKARKMVEADLFNKADDKLSPAEKAEKARRVQIYSKWFYGKEGDKDLDLAIQKKLENFHQVTTDKVRGRYMASIQYALPNGRPSELNSKMATELKGLRLGKTTDEKSFSTAFSSNIEFQKTPPGDKSSSFQKALYSGYQEFTTGDDTNPYSKAGNSKRYNDFVSSWDKEKDDTKKEAIRKQFVEYYGKESLSGFAEHHSRALIDPKLKDSSQQKLREVSKVTGGTLSETGNEMSWTLGPVADPWRKITLSTSTDTVKSENLGRTKPEDVKVTAKQPTTQDPKSTSPDQKPVDSVSADSKRLEETKTSQIELRSAYAQNQIDLNKLEKERSDTMKSESISESEAGSAERLQPINSRLDELQKSQREVSLQIEAADKSKKEAQYRLVEAGIKNPNATLPEEVKSVLKAELAVRTALSREQELKSSATAKKAALKRASDETKDAQIAKRLALRAQARTESDALYVPTDDIRPTEVKNARKQLKITADAATDAWKSYESDGEPSEVVNEEKQWANQANTLRNELKAINNLYKSNLINSAEQVRRVQLLKDRYPQFSHVFSR